MKQQIDNAEGIMIEVKGGTKNQFTRFWQEHVQTDEVNEFQEKSEKLKKHKQFLKFKDKVCEAPE